MALTKRLGYGLRIKILAFMIPLLVLVALAMGGYFSYKTSVLLRENEKKRILSLAQNLAYNSELGVSAEDADFLSVALKSILQDQVVKSAAVYNSKGKLIAGLPSSEILTRLPRQKYGNLSDDTRSPIGAYGSDEVLGLLQEVIVPVYMHSFVGDESEDLGTEEAIFGSIDVQVALDKETRPKKHEKKIIGYTRVSYSLRSINVQRNKFLASGGMISTLVLLSGVFISSIFARRITFPLNKLTNAVKDVGAGKLTTGIYVRSQDELGTLAEEFNRMIQGLIDARQKIGEYQKTLEEKVKKRTEELQTAYEELKELDEMKDAFVSSVSHELRTPLTSIRSFSEILLTYSGEDPETQREFLTIVNSESERLTRLINDVLDLAKIDAGKRAWNFERKGVDEVLKKVVMSMQSLLLEKEHHVEIHIQEGLPAFLVDEDSLLQVLTNLLGNAIKFTEKYGQIQIHSKLMSKKRAEDLTDFIHISVKDTGIGISPEALPKIFDRFRQVGDTLTDKPKGTGLGLSICKEIVTAHCGRIWVESTLGQGSTFNISIPVELPREAYQKKKRHRTVDSLDNYQEESADL